ncbi:MULTISPECIES: sugar transferase [unclassified Guyparkeria]|uniref:sugar transferase n=1 Tax=unclassified Guyparkeria TaxID=2626246 RepID=UPI0007333B00|nr:MULTISPECIES: sugar transferase [unclassified Guyparkeria]KTG16293.1 lipid carrier--UDP-N-acetylgalactosaminyltransferase [Guyparkeria sp. XI15]OAE85144.1 lipid carrier--UDP-N-acetylgalactosaminyltransferase [Guyparkeria sp. WRN-7]
MTRFLDVVLALIGLVVGLPVLLVLVIVGWLDTGSPIFRQERVGRHRRPFTLVKFRTMKPGTASRATHLTDAEAITRFGRFLRHTKLDELPQLWNVLKGEMSLVGPRPCLPVQEELIAARDARGVFAVRPGITGLAQVQGVDMSDPERLAELDQEMIRSLTLRDYFRYLFLTVTGKGAGDRVRPSS